MTITSKAVVLACGEILWDLFPEGPSFGGAPANFACHAAILGGDVSMLSAVGEDTRGREGIEILRAFGIDVSLIQKIAHAPTGTVEVELDSAGKPTYEIHSESAWDRIAWSPTLESRIAGADAIYFGTLGQRGAVSRATIRRALDLAKSRGIRRVLDVNLRPPYFDASLIRQSVERASVLKLSDDELNEVAAACDIRVDGDREITLRALLRRYELDLVAMTRGADGAVLLSETETIVQPGAPTDVCDTVGAGDSFAAALVIGLVSGDSLDNIARVACETAAAVCCHPGAVPLPPSLVLSRSKSR